MTWTEVFGTCTCGWLTLMGEKTACIVVHAACSSPTSQSISSVKPILANIIVEVLLTFTSNWLAHMSLLTGCWFCLFHDTLLSSAGMHPVSDEITLAFPVSQCYSYCSPECMHLWSDPTSSLILHSCHNCFKENTLWVNREYCLVTAGVYMALYDVYNAGNILLGSLLYFALSTNSVCC